MQNLYDSQSGVFDGAKEAKVFRAPVQALAICIWNMLFSKVSSAGKQARRYLDTLCSTDFGGKIIQGAVDYLRSHPSADYAIKTTVMLVAIFITCGVALEFVYLLRLIYWMVVYFFIRLITGIFTLLCRFVIILWAVLKFLLYWLSGVVLIYLLHIWALQERNKLSISQRNDTRQNADTTTGHVHQDKPDAPICSDFLLGECTKGVECPGHHCSLPFHWQYKVLDVDEWKSFSETDNETLEKLYCDVMLEDCSASGFQISLQSYDEKCNLKFLLDDLLMIIQTSFADFIVEIRRFSTESYASNPRSPMATAWTWCWRDENGMWREYGVDHLGRDLQRSLEEEFFKDTNCFKFTISDQDYALYFYPTTKMHQENLRYHTTRKVRRRPAEFKSKSDILELKSRSHNMPAASGKAGQNATGTNVPGHWSSMPSDKQYKRVPLTATSTEYKEMETLFKKTIKKTVVIRNIERLQNPFMWEKYQRKKANMLAVKTGGHKLNERRLFHGTSPETVEAICKQNFDWRLHGKNATKYGQGSYFALNSSYSDAYAMKDRNSYRFMFVANVLVGSYTSGHSSYRRPPQKDPSNPASDLYDSCVDNISNPTIFVVFDTDQCYPEYIIKYSP